MFKFQIEPWDEVRSIQIRTRCVNITLREDGDYVVYELREHGETEYVEYKFKFKKREKYKEYVTKLVELDVVMPQLKDLSGTMSFFRDVYQYALSMYRRGLSVDIAFKWQDGNVTVSYSVYASKERGEIGVQNSLYAKIEDEYIYFRHGGTVKDIEVDMARHTQRVIGLYTLFKEYVSQGKV